MTSKPPDPKATASRPRYKKRYTIILFLATFLYFRSLRRNTIEPVDSIVALNETQIDEVQSQVQHFVKFKTRESQYVQVAVSTLAEINVRGEDRT